MIRRVLLAALLLSAMALTQACMITNRDIESLKEQVRLNQKEIAEMQRHQEEHAMRLEGAENSIQMLEARVDENTERFKDREAGMIPAAAPGAEPLAPVVVPSVTAPEEPAAELALPEPTVYTPRSFGSPEDLYNSAYAHFDKREFGQAILEFEEYVANYGSTSLADNAQYWIGECYYAQKDYRQAIREFEKVEKNFPEGNKVAAARLKKGLSFGEMGNREAAARELEAVVKEYPDSEESILATEKLKQWLQGG